ncbi:MAG TPA: hypothetical protein VG826_00160 [Pirellulales bacterium]|nr:hypothetical protein [Pirellulales bacterium]
MRLFAILSLGCLLATHAHAQAPQVVETVPTFRPTISLDGNSSELLSLPASVVRSGPPDDRLAVLPTQPSYLPPSARTTGRTALKASPASCDDAPLAGLVSFVSYDAFRGISDGSWENNGIVTGLNYGTRLGAFSDLTGIGFQAGGSVGVFDWSGTDYRIFNQNEAETQGFVTYGFFRKPTASSKLNLAVVNDWMIVNNFGVYGQTIALSQWRVHAGYALNAANEVGLWGAWRMVGDSKNIAGVGPTTWRPIDQLNVFWHYKWAPGGADTWIWIGVPERHRLGAPGSLGDYLASAQANVPLNDRFSLYALVNYMHPSSRPGPSGANQDAWNFTIGVWFYSGRNARSSGVAGRCWLPSLPVANNGLFLVDTNRTY